MPNSKRKSSSKLQMITQKIIRSLSMKLEVTYVCMNFDI